MKMNIARQAVRTNHSESKKHMNWKMFWLVVSVFVLSPTLVPSLGSIRAQTLGKDTKDKMRISGTGNWSTTVVVRTEDPLEPPCVHLITRKGDATFTGFIQTLTNGLFETVLISNQCVDPRSDSVRDVLRLDDVVIAGRRGGIVITRKASSTGTPEGVATVSQLEIRGSSGELEDIRGHGLAVGRATLAESSNTYWVEIELDEKD
jgi:hypothetical protein